MRAGMNVLTDSDFRFFDARTRKAKKKKNRIIALKKKKKKDEADNDRSEHNVTRSFRKYLPL